MSAPKHIFQNRARSEQRRKQEELVNSKTDNEIDEAWALAETVEPCDDEGSNVTFVTRSEIVVKMVHRATSTTEEELRPIEQPSIAEQQQRGHRSGAIDDPWNHILGPPNISRQKPTTQSDRCIAAARAGIPLESIVAVYPKIVAVMRFPIQTAISEYDRTLSLQRTKMVVWILIGPTQTGKTTLAYNMAKELTKTDTLDEAQFTLSKIGKGNQGQSWFDGYRRQKVLVIDEYKGDEYSCIDLLNWMNPRRPTILPIKGSTTWANWEYIFITTNNDILTWTDPSGHAYSPENREALMARINFIYRFKSKTDINIQRLAPLTKTKPIETIPIVRDGLNEVMEFFA